MLLILLIDGRPSEMLGYALWGGILYAATCCLTWVLINKLAAFIRMPALRYIARFLAGLMVLYLIMIFGGGDLSHSNTGVLAGMHAIYTLSFVLASANYNRVKAVVTEGD